MGKKKDDAEKQAAASYSSRWRPAYARAEAKDKPDPIDWKVLLATGTTVLMLAFCSHIFSINDGLVLLDRYNLDYILNTQKIPEVAKTSMDDMFKRPLMQPWTKHSFISDRTDYGEKINWYHGANILFHVAAAGYLFAFVFQLIRELNIQKRLDISPYYTALGTGALFATHPITCETVAYLSSRSMLLGTTNFFGSLCFLLLGILTKNPWISAGGYALAVWTACMSIWSCPEMVSLPAVAFFLALVLKGPLADWKKSFAENKVLCGLLFLLAIAVPCLGVRGFLALNATNVGTPILAKVAYVASQIKAFSLYYLRCLVAPIGLSIDPPMAVASGFTDPFVLLALAIMATAAFLAWRARSVGAGLAVLFMLAGFVPHAAFIQPDAVADWVAYLPLAGMAILGGTVFATSAKKNVHSSLILLGCLSILLGGLSVYRDFQWSSNLTLWSSALEVRPKSGLAHACLATELVKRKQLDEADEHSKKAISLSPDLCIARLSRATVLLAQERYSAAEEQLIAAQHLADSQKLPARIKQEIKYELVESYLMQSQIPKAQAVLAELITAESLARDGRAFRIMGLAAFKAGQYKEALDRFIGAVQADAQLSDCWEMITLCALEMGDPSTAYLAATRWKEQIDADASTLLLARAALASDKIEEGEALLMELLHKNPNNANAAYVLSRHYKRMGKDAEATRYKEQAIKLKPDIESKSGHLPEMDRPLPKKAEEKAPAAPEKAPDKSSAQSSQSAQKVPAPKAADDNEAKPSKGPDSSTKDGTTQNKPPGTSSSSDAQPDTAKPTQSSQPGDKK